MQKFSSIWRSLWYPKFWRIDLWYSWLSLFAVWIKVRHFCQSIEMSHFRDLPPEILERYAVVSPPIRETTEHHGPVHILGTGAYGEVLLVRRNGTKDGGAKDEDSTQLAVKRCFACLMLDDLTTLRRTYREIAVLRQVRRYAHRKNIVALEDIVLPKTGCDLYLVFELASQDLEHAIRYSALDEDAQRQVSHDIAQALCFLHHINLMHRDVKPSNILLHTSGRAKLCDFGFVRHARDAGDAGALSKCLTEYVGMRWYRAPELLLGSRSYNQSIDATWLLNLKSFWNFEPLSLGTLLHSLLLVHLLPVYGGCFFSPPTKKVWSYGCVVAEMVGNSFVSEVMLWNCPGGFCIAICMCSSAALWWDTYFWRLLDDLSYLGLIQRRFM